MDDLSLRVVMGHTRRHEMSQLVQTVLLNRLYIPMIGRLRKWATVCAVAALLATYFLFHEDTLQIESNLLMQIQNNQII